MYTMRHFCDEQTDELVTFILPYTRRKTTKIMFVKYFNNIFNV